MTFSSIEDVFQSFDHMPFLFIGSGFSRRYLGTPDWKGFLEYFAQECLPGNPLAYQQITNGTPKKSLDQAASQIEAKFNEVWFSEERFQDSRKKWQDEVAKGASPFKCCIADYFGGFEKIQGQEILEDEISSLETVGKRSIAGIITTNYDTFLEEVFTNYKVYVGQEELLFSDSQGISEIYKIHGCCQIPESQIVTASDYKYFNAKNAYLAAKLLTVFVEHPIIFLGYSISDENIKSILDAISKCLTKENLQKLEQRMIFVEWEPNETSDIAVSSHSHSLSSSSFTIEMNGANLRGGIVKFVVRKIQLETYVICEQNKTSNWIS